MMTISPEGKVSVCSEDFFYSIDMGNVKDQSISDIWNSEKYRLYRERLLKGDRKVGKACSQCDYKGFTYEMLAENNLDVTKPKPTLKKRIFKNSWVFSTFRKSRIIFFYKLW